MWGGLFYVSDVGYRVIDVRRSRISEKMMYKGALKAISLTCLWCRINGRFNFFCTRRGNVVLW